MPVKNPIRPTWNPFSRYADVYEKKVDKLLHKVAYVGVFEAQREVLELMKGNLVILNLWLEARFKGYKYLSRGKRKRLYANAQRIAEAFEQYCQTINISVEAVAAVMEKNGVSMPTVIPDQEKLVYLAKIMSFLKPGGNYYVYLEGASFGKLLTDIKAGQKMIGDCNQIVTFYTYLYSLKYDINELQIKLPKNHVCLHFKGIDIEATAGGFANYKEYDFILPIVELISTNLLDVSDFRDKQIHIKPKEFLRSSQLAYRLSSQRDLVSKNLEASYHNVALEAMQGEDYDTALFFAEQAAKDLKPTILHNAVVYHVKAHNFGKARFFLAKGADGELLKYINEQEGFYNFEQNNLGRAKEMFQASGNREMIKAVYSKEYNQLQRRVAGLKDLATMRSYKSVYRQMLDLAHKMEDSQLAANLQDILKQL